MSSLFSRVVILMSALCMLVSLSVVAHPGGTHSIDNLGTEYFDNEEQAYQSCLIKRLGVYHPEAWSCRWTCDWHLTPNNLPVWSLNESCSGSWGYDVGLYSAIYPATPCPEGTQFVAPGICKSNTPPPDKNLGNCPSGAAADGVRANPCNAATGNKFQTESDDAGNGIALVRHYNSQFPQDVNFGYGWTSAIAGQRLYIASTTVQLMRANAKGEIFNCTATTCTGDVDSHATLTKNAAGYILTQRNGTAERYDTTGKLLSETDSTGRVTTYTYDTSGRVSTVTAPFGHGLTLAYDANNHIVSVTTAAGLTIGYVYDTNNNLMRVNYPDGTAKLYHYENATFPHHLTGISFMEANGTVARYSTYSYDSSGKAIVSEHSGGMERFGFSYDSDTQTTVTDATGTSEVMTFQAQLGLKRLVTRVNQADSKSLTQTFDPANNLTCKKDEEGRVVTYTYNAANQKLTETVGLVGDCTNPQTTAATRTTTYAYVSATLDAPTLISAPSVYSGGAKTTNLVYADARFPTLPTSITQAGFTPTATAISRTVGLSYNAFGQVIAIDGPRTDVNDLTTLTYYECTTGNACGRLQSVTNALGHVTSFTQYDAAGRLREQVDANGLVTTYTYDLRGRLASLTQTPPTGSARVTTYSYDAAGNVTSVTLPDSVTLTYGYDAAQKLRSVTDNLGNRVVYGYDLKGNRTQEQTLDPSGTLVRALETTYDVRNRVATINNAGSLTQQIHDAVGNLTQTIDPNQAQSGNATTHGYDALNRLAQTVNNVGGLTTYGYDAADRLALVKAPNNATTQYMYDDLGNLLQETSPDRGTTLYTYDSAGNVKSITDARGIATNYSYDAGNRLTLIDYPTDTDVVFTYDTGTACTSGIGRLCQVIDGSGTTQYGYDAFGNVVLHQQTTEGRSYVTRYAFDAGNRVMSITYPDNRVVSYARDGLGRVVSVTTTVNGQSQTILSNRSYRADGALLSQVYGNGLEEARDYNARGLLIEQSLGSADTRLYGYDANGNLVQKQSLPEVATYSYDALDRLLDELTSNQEHQAYTYDGNGNRLSDLKVNGTSRTYGYQASSNRLTTVGAQAVTSDAAGNILSDRGGNRTFSYNEAGRLTSVSINSLLKGSYTYNFQHQRTKKVRTGVNATTGATTTTTLFFHYDVDGKLLAESNKNGKLIRTYVWVEGQPVAQIRFKGTTQPEELSYLHSDHLDTPRLATNSNQAVVWRFESEAFGTGKPEVDPDGDLNNVQVPLRFAGQYADGETGLYYNWNRYYDPKSGRYVTSDPIGLEGGFNTYTYAENNSLRWNDPTGLFVPALAAPAAIEGLINTVGAVFAIKAAYNVSSGTSPSTLNSGNTSANDPQYCESDDDCSKIRKAINDLAAELRVRFVQASADIRELYTTRRTGRFSWSGHRQQFGDKQKALRDLIDKAKAKGCSYNPEADMLANLPYPSSPVRWMSGPK